MDDPAIFSVILAIPALVSSSRRWVVEYPSAYTLGGNGLLLVFAGALEDLGLRGEAVAGIQITGAALVLTGVMIISLQPRAATAP